MAPVKLIIEASAAKALFKMPRKDAAALRNKLEVFAADPYAPQSWAKRLVGVPAVRIRQGDWRAVCRIDGKALVVVVIKIGNRREVYE